MQKPLAVMETPRMVGHKVVIYGHAATGKSSLALTAPNPILFNLDRDPYWEAEFARGGFSWRVAEGCDTYEDLYGLLGNDFDDFDSIVIDSLSALEDLISKYVIENYPDPKTPEREIRAIESYVFGQGYNYMYQEMQHILGALDRLVRNGKNVILTAHVCTVTVNDPSATAPYDQNQPRLQSPPSGKWSIRHRIKEWCSYMLYLREEDGARTCHFNQTLSHWAKSRNVTCKQNMEVPFTLHDKRVWQLITNGDQHENADAR